MNQLTIIKELDESFRAIDCYWEDMSEAITLCLIKTAQYDVGRAIGMWHTLLKRNRGKLCKKEQAEALVSDLLFKISNSVFDNYNYESDYQAVLEKMLPPMMENLDLLDMLFGETYGGGIESDTTEGGMLLIFAGIILSGDTDLIRRTFKSLILNKNLKEVSVGDYMLRTVNVLNEIFEDDDFFPNHATLDVGIKSILLECSNTLLNIEEKSECKLAIVTIR